MTIESFRYQGGNKWEINGLSFNFHWKKNNEALLYKVLSKLIRAVFVQDHETVSKLFIKYKEKNLVNLLNFLEKFCPNEYTFFINSICNKFLTNKEPFNPLSVLNTILLGSSPQEVKWNSGTLHHCLAKTEVKKIVLNYINEKLISKIKVALKSFDKKLFWGTFSCLERPYLFKILQDELIEDFELFVSNCANEYIRQIKNTSYLGFISFCLTGVEDVYFARCNERQTIKFPIFKEMAKKIMLNFSSNKKEEYIFGNDEWTVIDGRKIESIKTAKLVFTGLKMNIKTDVKNYIVSLLDDSISRKRIQTILSSIKLILTELENLSYEINSLSDLNIFHVQHLITHFQNIKNDDGKRKYTLSTIRGQFTHMRLFIDWIIENDESIKMNNPFRKYKFKNASSFAMNPTEYIPEDIVEQLLDKLGSAPQYVQNTWTIMMHVGMRISEVIDLDVGCLNFNKEIGSYELSYIPKKNNQSRQNQGFDDHKVPVNSVVVDAINNQIDTSADLRLLSGSTKIFLTYKNNIVTQPNPSTISGHINKVIKKYNIKGSDDKLYYFKNHMCRKTLIVELLTKGQSIEAVADYIGHTEETSRRHYAEIEKRKLAELENAMFEKLLDSTLDEEIKKEYSFNERNSLITEIKLGVRETPEGHGYCTKHVSFGPCQKKSCVGCKMLITGPQKLPMWYKLYNEQKQYLNELADEYKDNNVRDYEEHRLFQQQQRLLSIYKDTIEKVEKFAIKEGIPIEPKAEINT